MAASPLHRIRRPLLRASLVLAGVLALIVLGYPLAGWIGSSIPENASSANAREAERSVEIMVETNGTHTGIVVPVLTAAKDWRETFPSAAMPDAYGRVPTHLSIGWGEREVFLHVPTWGDLRVETALRIATVGGDALMRVSHYVRPLPGKHHRPVRLSSAQYERLVAAIERPLPPVPPGNTREILRGTYVDDAYYEAAGSYTMINNCNTWVGDALAEAGIEMGMWTPFAGGVMKWIPTPQATP
ncbi:DUF2459 domain-containing protein [Aurantiacibacter hainanensis]|uniref:DUF2459 domain-containing protein n=1 Tax=Aurantiacibacter hainanensis TaxID=3076114 RepID=UPI0030C7362F